MSRHEVVFLHFNDVYHISKRDDIARFITQLEHSRTQYSQQQVCTIFSGDVFSPSLEASILRGAHMLPLLKQLKIDVACYGNHDFDFGEARLRQLAAETDFPWLLSNATRNAASPDDTDMLADAHKYHTTVLEGLKVGFFGLAGTDWPSNCRELPDCTIAAPVDAARACARHLRRVEKCDIVVAITHMRLVEDMAVSEALSAVASDDRVDLLLGGHDHELCRRYAGETSNDRFNAKVIDCSSHTGSSDEISGVVPAAKGDVRVVKSGTDWKSFSCVRLSVTRTAEGVASLDHVTVEQVLDLQKAPLDPVALTQNQQRIDDCLRDVKAKIDQLGAEPLAHTRVSLEGTGAVIRSHESNLCNMLADMVRAYYNVDIAFINSGGVRCDKLIPATTGSESSTGQALTVRDLIDILPFNQEMVVKRISSAVLLEALENSISDARSDGRFLQMAGLTLDADLARPDGQRVIEAWFYPPGAAAGERERVRLDDPTTAFSVAMVSFIADGFDGYACFKDQETLIGEEGGTTDTQLLLQTLGYGADSFSPGAADDSEAELARIQRARLAIVVEQSDDGLPVVAPRVEGRICFR